MAKKFIVELTESELRILKKAVFSGVLYKEHQLDSIPMTHEQRKAIEARRDAYNKLYDKLYDALMSQMEV